MKSIIRFLKTKSLFFPFTEVFILPLYYRKKSKKKSKTLRLYKKFAKKILKENFFNQNLL